MDVAAVLVVMCTKYLLGKGTSQGSSKFSCGSKTFFLPCVFPALLLKTKDDKFWGLLLHFNISYSVDKKDFFKKKLFSVFPSNDSSHKEWLNIIVEISVAVCILMITEAGLGLDCCPLGSVREPIPGARQGWVLSGRTSHNLFYCLCHRCERFALRSPSTEGKPCPEMPSLCSHQCNQQSPGLYKSHRDFCITQTSF